MTANFQFRLLELFVCLTTAAIVFACVHWWGVQGTSDRLQAALFVAGILATAIEIHYRVKKNLGQ